MTKIWDKIVNWLAGFGVDRWMHFSAGLIIAAIFALVLPMGAWCFVPVVFVAFIKEFIDEWRYSGFDWIDFAFTVIGGLVIALLALIGK